MPSGAAILAAGSVLVAFRCCDAALLTLGVSRRAAVLWLAATALASLANLVVAASPRMEINGAALLIVAFALWPLGAENARRTELPLRALAAAAACSAVLFGLAPWAPQGPTLTPEADGVAAGLVGALAGRTPLAALRGTLLGIPAAGLVQWAAARADRLPGPIRVAGGSAFDAGMLAAAVALCATSLVLTLRDRGRARTEGPHGATKP